MKSICQSVATELGFPSEEVTPSRRLVKDLWMDPFDTAELIEALEEIFAVSVSDDALASLRTMADIEHVLAASVSRRAA
jgi:acyl carrier protein